MERAARENEQQVPTEISIREYHGSYYIFEYLSRRETARDFPVMFDHCSGGGIYFLGIASPSGEKRSRMSR